MPDAQIFSLTWLSYGATIVRFSLINTLAICSSHLCTCASICGCPYHNEEVGKKDASYIAVLLFETVLKNGPTKLYTDVFYFDDVSNMDKAGNVLEAKFPNTFSLHGGKHVEYLDSLVFSNNLQ